MEDEILVPAGADFTHTVKVYDEDGNIFDCSIFTKLVIIAYHGAGDVIAKYSMNPAPGYQGIDMTDAVNGNLSIKLLTSHTNASPKGRIYTETHGLYADPSLPDDGVLDLLTRDNYLCTITPSITGNQIIP